MATKEELQKQLDELGVDYKANDDKATLEKLLEDNQPEEDEEESSDEEDEEESSDEEDAETEDEVATDDEDEVESEVVTEDATSEATRYGVYRGKSNNCVAVFTQENHGLDFMKLAESKAALLSKDGIDHEARPFIDPAQPEPDRNVVNIVNKNNNLVRQYNLVTHGKDYRKLAEAFVTKYGEKKGLHIQE